MKLPEPGRLMRLLVVIGGLGCGHTEPFGARTFDTDRPFDPAPPIQLTLNRGPDRNPSWLPDGSAILYSSQGVDTQDGDVCLGLLPANGGRQRARTCDLVVEGAALTEALEPGAAATDGRLAYVASTSPLRSLAPDQQDLVLASLLTPAVRTTLLSLPYTIPGRQPHSGISNLYWFGSNRLLYLGEAVRVITPCQFCQMDTIRTGRDVVTLALEPGAAPQSVPGTENASAVAPGASEDEVFYTLGGDTRVYRELLSTGTASVVHDFGTAGVARDVHVSGDRLTAIVGGRSSFAIDPLAGPTQWDSGGVVHVVNLQTGSDITLTDPLELALYRRPRFAPGGNALVVERYPLLLEEIRGPDGSLIRVDTIVSRTADLYLFQQP